MADPQATDSAPKIIGVVGGIASGKSYVSGLFAALGAVCVDADRIGHQVLTLPEIIDELSHIFGDTVLGPEGQLDRRQIGKLVFGSDPQSSQRLKALEQIVHPKIRQLVEHQVTIARQRVPPPKAILIDAPLLLEAGWGDLCDWILFVDSPAEHRRKRAMERGWTAEHFAERENSQMAISEKRARATHLILNGNNDDVPQQVLALWHQL